MGYEYEYMMEEFANSILETSKSLSTISSMINIATYVFIALTLYTIASRRDISKPWLAWIPVVNVWVLGSISDQYRYVVRGETKAKRKALLTLNLIMAVLSIVLVVVCVAYVADIIVSAMQGASENLLVGKAVSMVLAVSLILLVILGLTIAYAILYYMALYDLYASCDPANKVVYLVLSLIPVVSVVCRPLLQFLSRNRDDGMPPRREAPVPPYPGTEPWE